MYFPSIARCNGRTPNCTGNCRRNQHNNEDSDKGSGFLDLLLGAGSLGDPSSSLMSGTVSAIIHTCGPQIIELAKRYPKLSATPIVIWLATKILLTNIQKVWRWLISWALAGVSVRQDDTEFNNVVKSWIMLKAKFKSRRSLHAQSARNARHEGVKVEDDRKVVYTGDSSFQTFKHNGRIFIYSKDDEDIITIYTLGWSAKPVQDLLEEIQEGSQKKDEISVWTAHTSNATWREQCSSLRRTFDSVCLGPGLKEMLIADITEYLHHDSVLWYANRGTPYRRGFLLYGRPGCGKTSFAMAVAGHFDLPIYTVSLLDPGINDKTLLLLLQRIRKKSLVLLEDIDSAGLGREYIDVLRLFEEKQAKKTEEAKAAEASKNQQTTSTMPHEPMSNCSEKNTMYATGRQELPDNQQNNHSQASEETKAEPPPPKSQVTLSGLLNAIDGASAPTGHILNMTSNKPEALDEALIRSGRVDLKIEFNHATSDQIRELFVKMFKPIDNEKKVRWDMAQIEELANKFAKIVPANEFSPAEIQEYLIPMRVRPEYAVEKAGEWVEANMSEGSSTSDSGSNDQDSGILVESSPHGLRSYHGGLLEASAGRPSSFGGAGNRRARLRATWNWGGAHPEDCACEPCETAKYESCGLVTAGPVTSINGGADWGQTCDPA